jgi:ABC-type cobalamin/Fe3+-siderophores transport system ATPase subunit
MWTIHNKNLPQSIPKLAIDNLKISINTRALIKNFYFKGYTQEILAICGSNGSGKTSLLKTIAGIFPYNEGQILIDNKNLKHYSSLERAQNISFLLQHSPTANYYTGMSRVAHGLMPLCGFDFYLDEHITRPIRAVAERLGISHLLNKPLHHLSGGELRLIDIAKCLINPLACIMLLDEPSVFLDHTQKNRLIKILKEEANLGKLIIFTSHEEEFIKRLAIGVIFIDENHNILLDNSTKRLSKKF